MIITKSSNNILRHHEVKIRTVMKDSLNFIARLVNDDHHIFRKKPLNILFRLTVCAVMFLVSVIVSLALYKLGAAEFIRTAFSVAWGMIIVRFFIVTRPRYRSIKDEDMMECVADTTLPSDREKEKNSFYNFGEEGFLTNAYGNQSETFFHRYSDLARAVMCHEGIILIYQDKAKNTRIYCVPSRFIDNDTTGFVHERLKKKMGKRFIFASSLEIIPDENGEPII